MCVNVYGYDISDIYPDEHTHPYTDDDDYNRKKDEQKFISFILFGG